MTTDSGIILPDDDPDIAMAAMAASLRVMPHVEVRHLVHAFSSRHGTKIELMVVHDTEGPNRAGLSDLIGLGNYFDRAGSQESSTVATDAEGNSARYVRDDDKAWHVAYYNPWALGIEQIGFASQGVWPVLQVRETARWLAYWSHLHGIPIRKGRVTVDGRIITSGVVRHSELGNLGGGHHDPGTPYPLHDCMEMARDFVRHY